MENCIKCLRNNEEVKLVDAIENGEIVKLCEECAISEQVPIIRRPTSFQLNETEKSRTVRERLSRMAGLPTVKKAHEEIRPKITLDNLRPSKDYSQIIQEKARKAKTANKPIDLIDNYNWHIRMARRTRKLSLTQLSAMIGESELILKMIENGETFDDILRIVLKIEQFFKINLRKSEALKEQERIERVKQPARILSLDPESLKKITIADLKKMKDEREKIEEAEKIAWAGTKSKEEKKEDKKNILGSYIEIIEDSE